MPAWAELAIASQQKARASRTVVRASLIASLRKKGFTSLGGARCITGLGAAKAVWDRTHRIPSVGATQFVVVSPFAGSL